MKPLSTNGRPFNRDRVCRGAKFRNVTIISCKLAILGICPQILASGRKPWRTRSNPQLYRHLRFFINFWSKIHFLKININDFYLEVHRRLTPPPILRLAATSVWKQLWSLKIEPESNWVPRRLIYSSTRNLFFEFLLFLVKKLSSMWQPNQETRSIVYPYT